MRGVPFGLALSLLALLLGLATPLPGRAAPEDTGEDLRWPMGSGDDANVIVKTYGQYMGQGAGTSRYHLGVDLLRSKSSEPVFAMEKGKVVSVVDTDLWTNGVLVQSEAVPTRAILYLHLEAASIQKNPGDYVEVGDCLGCVADWDDEACTDYDHLHLSVLEGFETWASDYFPTTYEDSAIQDPLTLIREGTGGDTTAPVIAELVIRSDESASSTKIFDVDNVEGKVDVLVRVEDLHDPSGTPDRWPLGLARVSLTIEDLDSGTKEEWSLCLDGPIGSIHQGVLYNEYPPEATGGPAEASSFAKTCALDHVYYFIVTNGSDECSADPEVDGGWSPAAGSYRLTASAVDTSGNEAALVTMDVTVP